MSEEQPELSDFAEGIEEKEESTDAPDEAGEQEWDWTPLSELIEPVLGKTPKRSEDEYWGGNIKWASAKDVSQSSIRHVYDTEDKMTEAGKEESNAKILPEGTVVVVARGATMGRLAQLGEPMTFNQTCYGLDTTDELLDDFLYYAWQYVFGQVQAVSYGTVFDTITMKSFKDIEIPHPPIETQKRIAETLTAFDDKIETNNRINELLEETAQILYRSWFIDFDPYDEFKDSELGEIPVEFEVTEFSNLCETYSGGPRQNTDDYIGNKYKWLTAKDISSNSISTIYNTERKLNEKAMEDNVMTLMEPNSVLLTSRATIGEVIINKEPMATNQGYICIEPAKEIPSHYLLHLVNSKKDVIKNRATGSTYPEISQSGFESIPIPLAPKEDRIRYEETVAPIYDCMYHNLKENNTLSELRDTLLPKLMSGEIRLDPDSNNEPMNNN